MTPRDPAWWVAWLRTQALPLWADAGFDRTQGTFVERLALDASPLPDVPRRVMVQARQIHVYATAARHGWFAGADALAVRAGDAMIARYGGGDGREGWAFSADRAGAVLDARRDLYAQAFVLLALAGLIRLDPRPAYRAIVRHTLAFLDRVMADPAGGYVEQHPCPILPRRQNPHMHLFEAYLALHETGFCGDFSDRIAVLIGLFDRFFLPPGETVLAEYYEADWGVAGRRDAFEPGHHFEWIWLLVRYADISGHPVSDRTDRLLPAAMRGIDAAGRVIGGMGTAEPIDPRSRLWGMMEAAKAFGCPPVAFLHPAAMPDALEAAWRSFLRPAIPGGWIDHIAANGEALVDHIPASSLYHICTAVDFLYRHPPPRKR